MTPFPETSGIYRITCTVTGKIYIGSAINLCNRKGVHLYELRRNKSRNPKLQHAWNKYGADAFTFEILELVLLPEMLTVREQYWLDMLKPFGKNGFNIDLIAGSRLGSKHTPETLKKIGLASRGNKHSLGMRLSPERNAKLHAASAAATMKTLIVTAPDGTEYTIVGISKFCREHRFNISSLMRVAYGKSRQYKGWKARFP